MDNDRDMDRLGMRYVVVETLAQTRPSCYDTDLFADIQRLKTVLAELVVKDIP